MPSILQAHIFASLHLSYHTEVCISNYCYWHVSILIYLGMVFDMKFVIFPTISFCFSFSVSKKNPALGGTGDNGTYLSLQTHTEKQFPEMDPSSLPTLFIRINLKRAMMKSHRKVP